MAGLEQYIPPNLRRPIRDIGNLGYSLLDNVVGIDDGYDSAGERLGRQVRDDPFGMAKAMGGGLLSGAANAVMNPIDTVKDVASGIGQSYSRASRGADSYLPEGVDLASATVDQMRAANDAYLADVVGVAGVVPAARAATGAARMASNIDTGALAADTIGLGRAIGSGDLGLIGEVLQQSGEAQGLSADIPRIPVRGYDPQTISLLESNFGLRDEAGRANPDALRALASQFDAFGNRISNIQPDKKTGLTYKHPASNVRMSTPIEQQVVSSISRGEANPRMATALKEGEGLIAALGDRVVADRNILGYSGQTLMDPQQMFGGTGYLRDSVNDRIWASDEAFTSPLLKSLNRASDEGLDPRMIYTSMGAQSSDFATNGLIRDFVRNVDVDPNLRQVLADKLRKSKDFTDKDFPFDDLISGGGSRRNRTGLLDGVDEYIGKMNGSQRRAIWQAMDSAPFRDAGIPIGEMRLAQTDPDLMYANPLDTGLNLGRPDLSEGLSQTSMHPVYPTSIMGAYDGSLPVQVPAAITFRDFFNQRRGLLDGFDETKAASDQRSFQMSHGGIVSEVDGQMVDEVGKFTDYWRAFNE